MMNYSEKEIYEKAFNISMDEDDCLELYDMDLSEAADKIAKMIQKNSRK